MFIISLLLMLIFACNIYSMYIYIDIVNRRDVGDCHLKKNKHKQNLSELGSQNWVFKVSESSSYF